MASRRQVLAAAVVAPFFAARPAIANDLVCSSADPIPEYLDAFRAYDEDDPASVARHAKACAAMHQWAPDSARDMLRKIVVTLDDDGRGPEPTLRGLIQQADRLLSEKS
ncbi:hypothetical protein [Sphingobium sp. CAP-1]|uniref:hypothetical protein n=1 Tax=Sphingobium sp. CAP-1 TaxID=2676077 RepID=UPI0012BB2423|nr:hypothetical protein [Sphingobium sp. CAP-1]QGP80022.1 hypothetical protein GL174_14275 [Sphingobium sp. CAP-1]